MYMKWVHESETRKWLSQAMTIPTKMTPNFTGHQVNTPNRDQSTKIPNRHPAPTFEDVTTNPRNPKKGAPTDDKEADAEKFTKGWAERNKHFSNDSDVSGSLTY